MIASAKRRFIPGLLVSLLVSAGACGGSHSSGGTAGHEGAGAGGHAGAGGASGGAGSTAGSGGGGADGGSPDGAGGTGGGAVDAGPLPPSCAPGGPGLTTCGAGHESCCTSLPVPGGSYDRTYTPGDAGAADGGLDPASVSAFRLDEYDVTVGRFRQFVEAVLAGDGGASDGGAGDGGAGDGGTGWRPAEGAGKHVHLASGQGLTDVGPDAGAAHEKGWAAADDGNLVPTDTNLRSCGAASTWTPAPGTGEARPINCVNWYEAYAFCIWDGGFLPTEAEWEYAAAGGGEARAFPWGASDPGTMNQYAVYNCLYPTGASSCASDSDENVAPVGTATLGAGRWGQLDLAGNQSQWNMDWYAPYVTPCADCAYLTGGSSRVLRGGGYGDQVANLHPTYRDANNPMLRNDFIGIRCARSP